MKKMETRSNTRQMMQLKVDLDNLGSSAATNVADLQLFGSDERQEALASLLLNHPEMRFDVTIIKSILSCFTGGWNRLTALRSLKLRIDKLVFADVFEILTMFDGLLSYPDVLKALRDHIANDWDKECILALFDDEKEYERASAALYLPTQLLERTQLTKLTQPTQMTMPITTMSIEQVIERLKSELNQHAESDAKKDVLIRELRNQVALLREEADAMQELWGAQLTKKKERIASLRKQIEQRNDVPKQVILLLSKAKEMIESAATMPPMKMACVICMERDRTILLEECGHFVACDTCLDTYLLPIICPICHTKNSTWRHGYI